VHSGWFPAHRATGTLFEMRSNELEQRLGRVREAIEAACGRSGRRPEAVRLVAVTKGHPFTVVEAALNAGLEDLGENRVEHLVERAARVDAARCRWHMIGRLQRRQAPELHGVAHLVHSVDSERLAERLDRTAPEGGDPLPILVQVNTSGEAAKGGFEPAQVVEGVGRILELGALEVRGLMTMAPHVSDEATLRATFRGLRGVAERLAAELPQYRGTELSMGMSNDYALAVEEGSTMVRLGTALFGEREG
jgi:PLP dependent protein